MSLESLMPKERDDSDCACVSLTERCGCHKDTYNQALTYCLASLKGKVIALEDLPNVEEITQIISKHIPCMNTEYKLRLVQAIRALIERKAEVKGG